MLAKNFTYYHIVKILLYYEKLLLLNPSAYDKFLGSSFCISQVLSMCFPFVLIHVLQLFVSSHMYTIQIEKKTNKREPQKVTINHSLGFDFKDFMKIYKKCTGKPYCFSFSNITLPSDNLLRFRQNLLEVIYNNHDNW